MNLGGVATATWKGQEINEWKTYLVFERIALSKKSEKVFDSLTCSEGSHSILIIDAMEDMRGGGSPRRQIQEPLRIMEKELLPEGRITINVGMLSIAGKVLSSASLVGVCFSEL